MTPLQEKQFDILKYFIEICEKNNLTYFLVCGSALGAAKYQGFIPWDDDIDVALTRKDYELFLQVAQKQLPKHLFVQNYKVEEDSPYIYTKLRNSETTYIEKSVAHIKMNHGVYIDIFPLDGYPRRKCEITILEVRKTLYNLQLSCVYNFERSWKARIIKYIGTIMGYSKRVPDILNKYNQMISRYSTNNSYVLCNHGNWQGKLEYAPKWHYGQGTWANFEGMRVRIPENYDEYLTQKYGDWRADIPENEKQGHHYYTICDLDTSYTEYMLKNGK